MQLTIVLATSLYQATLLNCYDGDSCTVRFENTPAIIATQRIRFYRLDTPEINGACEEERQKARAARAMTLRHIQNAHVKAVPKMRNGKPTAQGRTDKYGRLLVYAPDALVKELYQNDMARPYTGSRSPNWCP